MKITHNKYPNHNLANETERGENLAIDFIISSILGILVVIAVYTIVPYEKLELEHYLKGFGVYLGVRFLYYFFFEIIYSRTPGKFQTQSIVVNNDGKKPTIGQLLTRNLIRFISVLSGISDDERAIHDIASNTFVVQDSKLKRIESRQYMILIFNIILVGFWIFYITKESGKSSSERALLIVLILATVYAVVVGYRRIGKKKNLKKYR